MSSLKDEELFESVDLNHSKVQKKCKVGSTNQLADELEDIISGSDEDELDPTEFLSKGNPIPNKSPAEVSDISKETDIPFQLEKLDSVISKQESSDVIKSHDIGVHMTEVVDTGRNSKGLSNSLLSSDIIISSSQSSIFNISHSLSRINEEIRTRKAAIKSIEERIKELRGSMYTCMDIHKKMLASGGNDLNNLRKVILQSFEELSECSLALVEQCTNYKKLNEEIKTEISVWDGKRTKILDKVSYIKSSKSKAGYKLSVLANEESNIINQISQLEEKLRSLRIKRDTICTEIRDTSSVLESKTTKYVSYFRSLEKEGELAIKEYFENTLFSNPDENIIAYTPVDVTFRKSYESDLVNQGHERGSKYSYTSFQPAVHVIETDHKKVSKDSCKVTSSNNQADKGNVFEQGKAEGFKQSEILKKRLSEFTRSFLGNNKLGSSVNKTGITRLDDVSNTVMKKLDVNAANSVVLNELASLQKMISETSENTELYYQAAIVWADIIKVMEQSEDELLEELNNSINPTNVNIEKILYRSLSKLSQILMEKAKKFDIIRPRDFSWPMYLFKTSVKNELDALQEAFKLVSKKAYTLDEGIKRLVRMPNEENGNFKDEMNTNSPSATPEKAGSNGKINPMHLLNFPKKSPASFNEIHAFSSKADLSLEKAGSSSNSEEKFSKYDLVKKGSKAIKSD